jgi:hypothetical protein
VRGGVPMSFTVLLLAGREDPFDKSCLLAFQDGPDPSD